MIVIVYFFYKKEPSFKAVLLKWSGWHGSNVRPLRPKRSALPAALHPVAIVFCFMVSTCLLVALRYLPPPKTIINCFLSESLLHPVAIIFCLRWWSALKLRLTSARKFYNKEIVTSSFIFENVYNIC